MDTAKATAHLLKSKKARSYKINGKTYVLDIEKEDQELIVTTWGFDYEGFIIPQTRVELIREKTLIQFQLRDGRVNGIDQVALRYYLDILRRNS
jgi:hypothetical protein